jgi:hypothetical protein
MPLMLVGGEGAEGRVRVGRVSGRRRCAVASANNRGVCIVDLLVVYVVERLVSQEHKPEQQPVFLVYVQVQSPKKIRCLC